MFDTVMAVLLVLCIFIMQMWMESNPFQRFSHQLPVIDEIYLIDKLLEHQNLECLPLLLLSSV